MARQLLMTFAVLFMSTSAFADLNEAKAVLKSESYTCRVFLYQNLIETQEGKPLTAYVWLAKDPNYEVQMNSEYTIDPHPEDLQIIIDLQASPNLATYRKLESIPYTADTNQGRTICYRQTFIGEKTLLSVVLPDEMERVAEGIKARKWRGERPSSSSVEASAANGAQ